MSSPKTPPTFAEIARGIADIGDSFAEAARGGARLIRAAKQVKGTGERAIASIRHARPRISVDENGRISVDITGDNTQGDCANTETENAK